MNKTKALATRLVVLTALSLFAAVSALAQEAAPIASKMDEYLSVAAKQGFTGSALVARDGKVIFSKGYGMANAEWDIPNTPQTKFRLGSITKQFTAASILLLQERGKLSVQDPVCKYIAELPENVGSRSPFIICWFIPPASRVTPTSNRRRSFDAQPVLMVTPAGFVDSFKEQAARISRRRKDEVTTIPATSCSATSSRKSRVKSTKLPSGEYLHAAENGRLPAMIATTAYSKTAPRATR